MKNKDKAPIEKKSVGREALLQTYCSLVKRNKRSPSRADLLSAGYNRDKIRHYFGNLINLRTEARKQYPNLFVNIIDEGIFTSEHIEKLETDVAGYRRFVITTAVTGCKVFKPFLKSIEHYCKVNNAFLLVLPVTDPASAAGFVLSPLIRQERVVIHDLRLNKNVFLSTVKTSAKQIDPLTGLDRVGQRSGTFIYGSPKQRHRLVPMGNSSFPHALMTTGAITKANYRPDPDKDHAYMSERTSYIATVDHTMGAIILELDKKDRFHFRQIQADKNGGFIDLSRYYLKDSVTEVHAEAFVMGDWHSGETDPTAKRSWKEITDVVKPREIYIHDGFNGRSINPHERHQTISLALKANYGHLSLAEELRKFAEDLDELQTWSKNGVVVVESNHDLFLKRWLEEGFYLKDPYNYELGAKLALAMIEGRNPLQVGVELMGLKNKSRVKWLSEDDDYRVAGVQMAAHGHKGGNGRRNPSMAEIEKCYGQSMTAHTHSSEILRGAWRVGTSSYLKLNYNKGPSSWVHCSGLVYGNGGRQLIHSFDGRWTTMFDPKE